MSVPMAITDFVPVALYLCTMCILIHDLNGKMRIGCFTLFSGGVVMSFLAGVFKATWKLLYAMGICDFDKLNQCFFPMQATGFVLVALALLLMLLRKGKGKKSNKILSIAAAPAAPSVFSGTFIFVGMMVAGVVAICGVLSSLAKKLNRKRAMLYFLIACVGLIGMGYLSSQNFEKAFMNWLAEIINIVSQGLLLIGTISLHKAGLMELDLSAKLVPAVSPAEEALPSEEYPSGDNLDPVPSEEAPLSADMVSPEDAESSNPDGRILW